MTLEEERTTTMRVLTDVKERAWLEAKMTIADGHDSEMNAFSSLISLLLRNSYPPRSLRRVSCKLPEKSRLQETPGKIQDFNTVVRTENKL